MDLRTNYAILKYIFDLLSTYLFFLANTWTYCIKLDTMFWFGSIIMYIHLIVHCFGDESVLICFDLF